MTKIDEPMPGDAELEAFFRAARAEAPRPSEALSARIMADALAEIAAREAPRAAPARRRAGWLAGLVGGLGGWPALAGMVTATAAGVWLGFAAPDQLNTLSGGLLLPASATGATTSYELEDILPGYGLASLNEEG